MPKMIAVQEIELLDLAEVAQLVGRSAWTINLWVKRGLFPQPLQAFPGAKKQWRAATVRAWIEKRARARYQPPAPRGRLRKI